MADFFDKKKYVGRFAGALFSHNPFLDVPFFFLFYVFFLLLCECALLCVDLMIIRVGGKGRKGEGFAEILRSLKGHYRLSPGLLENIIQVNSATGTS